MAGSWAGASSTCNLLSDHHSLVLPLLATTVNYAELIILALTTMITTVQQSSRLSLHLFRINNNPSLPVSSDPASPLSSSTNELSTQTRAITHLA